MGLVVTRRAGQGITIEAGSEKIDVFVHLVREKQVLLRIEAAQEVRIRRSELAKQTAPKPEPATAAKIS